MLDKWLQYHATPEPGDFASTVMRQVRRLQRMRRMILVLAGLIGAAFGVFGATLLAGELEPFFVLLKTGQYTPVFGLAAMALLGFFAWLLHDGNNLSV